MKNPQPRIVWTVGCYHYKTTTRTVPHIDSESNIFDRDETFKEKVTTHTESQVSTKYFIYTLSNLYTQIDGYVQKIQYWGVPNLTYLQIFRQEFKVLPNFMTIEITNLWEQLYSIVACIYAHCHTSFHF